MGNISHSATPLLPSQLSANVKGKRMYSKSTQAGCAAGHLAEIVGRGSPSPTRRTLPQREFDWGGTSVKEKTQAYQVELIANESFVQNVRANVRLIEIFSANKNYESTAYDPFVLEILKTRQLVRAASRNWVVGPRRSGVLRRVQR